MATETLPQALPHSDEAERSVLGAVLLDNHQFHRAAELLGAASFYSPRHQKIFQAMQALAEAGRAIDLVTLKDQLERTRDLEACGGPAYLASLVDGVPRSANVEYYAEIVKDKAVRRQLLRAAHSIVDAASGPEGTADQLLDMAEGEIFRVAGERLRSGFRPLSAIAAEGLKVIEGLTQRREVVTGIPTGLTQLDEMTAGLHPADLVILAARPAMGKTALALGIGAHAALRAQRKVGIFSLEMSHLQLFMRLLCAEARVDNHRLRTGRVSNEDWQRIIRAYSALSSAPIFIDESPGVTILEMRAKARRLAYERGLDLLIVDYLQLMRGRGVRYESRQQEISDISRSLKELAKELHVPVVALSQLSRAPEQRGRDRRPQLSDLRESGAIEQDADVVLFLYREEVYRRDDPELRGRAELIIGKQRNGPIGTLPLVFIREYMRFENPARHEGLDEARA